MYEASVERPTVGQGLLDAIAEGAAPPPVYIEKMSLLLASLAWRPGEVIAEFDVPADLCVEPNVVFGGHAAAMHDQVGGLVMLTVLPDDRSFVTATLELSFLAPLRPGHVVAKAQVVVENERSAEVMVVVEQAGHTTSRSAITQVFRPVPAL